ncbi:MAG: riboflavin biosynthesis protein RibF [Oscillospiraceae bacterium]|jgi:riboflavin kinase/FMN adenylyltransferase|nr:riboflavin biosynthesis protein RibF [Oscillospiraceae bacterium]
MIKIGVALGYFDGVHIGHKQVVAEAARGTDKIAVFTFTGLPPKMGGFAENITDEPHKEELLHSLGVSEILAPPFEDIRHLSPEEFVDNIIAERMNADVVTSGADFRFGERGAANADDLARLCGKRGIEARQVGTVLDENGVAVSSSLIREKLKQGEIAYANKLLGYDISYTLEVLRGNMLGRTLNAPTINQKLTPGVLSPKRGVYAGYTRVNGITYPSVTNIGVKPTVGSFTEPLLETHIIGWDGDLYGQHITVSLLRFIREEQKFGSLEELKSQIESDKRNVVSKTSLL